MKISASLRPTQTRYPKMEKTTAPAVDDLTPSNPTEKEWTFLFYNAGQGSLSAMATDSLKELERVGSDENTHVVALNHRERAAHERLLGLFDQYEGSRTYYVTKQGESSTRALLGESLGSLADLALSGPHKLKSEVISSEDLASGISEPESLKRFLVDNMKRFPAKHYALVMTGHGAAFQGQMITRDQEGRHALGNDDLGNVLREVSQECGQGVDLVNLNTCYSANLEALYSLKDSTQTVVASQAALALRTQPFGKVLSEVQQRLRSGTEVGSADLGRIFVEQAASQPLASLYSPSLSALDAPELGRLGKTVGKLQEACIERRISPQAIRDCLSDAVGVDFARDAEGRQVDLTDLGSLASAMAENISDPQIRKAAGEVQRVLDRAVLAEQHGAPESLLSKAVRKIPYLVGPQKSLEGATGLTVFWEPEERDRQAMIAESDYGRENPIGRFMAYLTSPGGDPSHPAPSAAQGE